MSPMASTAQIIKTAISGNTSGPYTDSGNVWTQMKLAAGAASMPERSK